jgi:Fe-S-cluster containining protein
MATDWLLQAEAICMRCGGHCCTDNTQPPVSPSCFERLVAAGTPAEAFEYDGYRRLRLQAGGACILFVDGRCSNHGIKPETCRAGPFTFDVSGGTIGIYLKKESICPVVRLLKEEPEAYAQQFSAAVKNITHLVNSLPDRELAAICRIEEPETELVATIPRDGNSHP